MMKLLSVVGARPQFIKLSPLCRAIKAYNNTAGEKAVDSVLVHTGQHYDEELSQIFFDEMQIPSPQYNLAAGSARHGEQTGVMLERLEKVLLAEMPNIVIVFGDTNSTLAGALAAAKLQIPVAHIEAGLRSHNRAMPEEINRLVSDHISTLLFCPTERAVSNLEREGFVNILRENAPTEKRERLIRGTSPNNPLVIKTGDLMYDAFLFNIQRAEKSSTILNDLSLAPRTYGLLTLHRAENTDNRGKLNRILSFLESDGIDTPLIFPAHPRTQRSLREYGVELPGFIRIVPPVSYFDMIVLEKHASAIYTDSGGVQKEAFFLEVPCVTLREETEWTETVESGWNRLMKNSRVRASTNANLRIVQRDIFGDGRAAERDVQILIEFCRATLGRAKRM
jgi:UDP-GlcNAc3NAcA epimerase